MKLLLGFDKCFSRAKSDVGYDVGWTEELHIRTEEQCTGIKKLVEKGLENLERRKGDRLKDIEG